MQEMTITAKEISKSLGKLDGLSSNLILMPNSPRGTFHDIGLIDLALIDPNDPFFASDVNENTPNFGAEDSLNENQKNLISKYSKIISSSRNFSIR